MEKQILNPLREQDMKQFLPVGHYVYWIRPEHYTDPYTQGYIGISQDPPSRLSRHWRDKRHFFSEPKTVMEILHRFDERKDALEKEREYRPETFIGWNIAKGGGAGHSDWKGTQHDGEEPSLEDQMKSLYDYCRGLEEKIVELKRELVLCRYESP